MKWKSRLFNFFKLIFLTIAGGLAGIALGFLVYGNLFPLWNSAKIATDRSESAEILFVDYYYISDDFTKDTVYIKTHSGNIYSVFQGNWTLLPPLKSGFTVSEIRRRDGYADSPIVAITHQEKDFQLLDGYWEPLNNSENSYWGFTPKDCAKDWQPHPPIKGLVLDSAGVQFEHALANSAKCYVLLDGGILQVWTRTTDAFSLMATLTTGLVVGALIGFIIGLSKHYSKGRKLKNSDEAT
jgi:hypothetical protein